MYGTRYEERDGRLARVVDRTGVCHAELRWAGDRLEQLIVDGATVEGAVITDPLLGDAHRVGGTVMSALDWARPVEVPAIAAPAALPPGAGGALLNVIALLAQRAEVTALRYAGPYPTAVLWRSLLRSFCTEGDEATFTAGALDRALRVDRTPIAIEFRPAPHERVAITRGFVELRDGAERAVVDGVAYEAGGSPARLIARPDGGHDVEVWFGDARYARVATLDSDGALVEGPHALPASASPVVGREFPPALCGALAELIAEVVPPPLAGDARALCARSSLCWADLGARAAREQPGGFAVHAALWDRVGPLGLGRLALALAEALAPVVAAAVVARAARAATLEALPREDTR